MKSIRASSLVLAAGLLMSAGGAAAQSLSEETDFGLPQFYGRGKNVSVMERERPDYQALGVHAGGFTLLPKIEVGMDYTDNLYAVSANSSGEPAPFNGPKSDVGFIINPSILAESNWGRHSLTALASVRNEDFTGHASEDQTSWTIQSDGRIDVHGDSYINLGFDDEHAFEGRGSTSTQTQARTPVPYDTEGVYVRGLYGADRLRASVDADFRNYHYFDVNQINPDVGGLPQPDSVIDESLRDFTQGRVMGRVDYALTPDEAVFTQVSYASGDYLNGSPFSPKRNYSEVRALAGANFDITALARGEIGIGYVDRSYALGTYHGLTGLAASAKVEYFPTQLVTVTLTGQRLVQDASFSTAGGYFENLLTLGADYELRRNIIISAIGGLELDDFQGIDRNDTATDFKLLGKYFLSRYVGLGATLEYTDRSSSGIALYRGPIYDETRLTFSLVFQR